jgi:flavin-dependent dehydrogenase
MCAEKKTLEYDVVIIGAGPAGCAYALTLRNAGLTVALIDKTFFPRDKVCGDAIPGRAIKTIKSISSQLGDSFKKFGKKYEIQRTTLHYKKKSVAFNWVREAYTCSRLEFDNFLFSLVREYTNTKIFTNTTPDTFIKNDDGF